MAETARKPFNRKEALAGKPVVTRDGRKVVSIKFHDVPEMKHPLSVVVEGGSCAMNRTADGKAFTDGTDSCYDIFMDVVEKEAWVNLYPFGCGTFEKTYRQHTTEKEADRMAGEDADKRLGGKAHRITWTE